MNDNAALNLFKGFSWARGRQTNVAEKRISVKDLIVLVMSKYYETRNSEIVYNVNQFFGADEKNFFQWKTWDGCTRQSKHSLKMLLCKYYGYCGEHFTDPSALWYSPRRGHYALTAVGLNRLQALCNEVRGWHGKAEPVIAEKNALQKLPVEPQNYYVRGATCGGKLASCSHPKISCK